jgi:hypothetical protein
VLADTQKVMGLMKKMTGHTQIEEGQATLRSAGTDHFESVVPAL